MWVTGISYCFQKQEKKSKREKERELEDWVWCFWCCTHITPTLLALNRNTKGMDKTRCATQRVVITKTGTKRLQAFWQSTLPRYPLCGSARSSTLQKGKLSVYGSLCEQAHSKLDLFKQQQARHKFTIVTTFRCIVQQCYMDSHFKATISFICLQILNHVLIETRFKTH